MYPHRLIPILLLLLAACKATQPATTTGVYSEDLTYLRPELDLPIPVEQVEPVQLSTNESVEFPGNIREELDSINALIAERNKSVKFTEGYTIQIYTGNDRAAANQASSLSKQLFPDMEPIISYYQPSYRVKVGQFTNRLVAHEKFEAIKKSFPKALLIPERIRINND